MGIQIWIWVLFSIAFADADADADTDAMAMGVRSSKRIKTFVSVDLLLWWSNDVGGWLVDVYGEKREKEVRDEGRFAASPIYLTWGQLVDSSYLAMLIGLNTGKPRTR